MTLPFTVGARMMDAVMGKERVNIDTHHTVDGDDPARWADEFLRNPSKISPIAANARREGERHVGQPFPLGPDIGITVLARRDGQTSSGRLRTTLDVRYSGAFEGPGRITITQNRDGTLDVRDQWNDVLNKSFLPSAAAETGHPLVAGLGFKGIGSRASGHQADLITDVGEAIVSTSFKVMTTPFRLFFGS
jgi:hypothetical protein